MAPQKPPPLNDPQKGDGCVPTPPTNTSSALSRAALNPQHPSVPNNLITSCVASSSVNVPENRTVTQNQKPFSVANSKGSPSPGTFGFSRDDDLNVDDDLIVDDDLNVNVSTIKYLLTFT